MIFSDIQGYTHHCGLTDVAAAEDAREIADDAARPERVAVVENESGRTGRAKGVDAPGADVGGEGGDV